MQSPFDVHIKSEKPVEIPPCESDARPCMLRLGPILIPTHHGLIESLPALSQLSAEQESDDIISLSPLLKHQPCLTPDGVRIVIDFAHGKEIYVEPPKVADVLAAANAFRMDDLISQVEIELGRLAGYDDSVLFSLEHAALNMTEESLIRNFIIQTASSRLEKICNHRNFVKIVWPAFEVLMKNSSTDVPPYIFMDAFLKWVASNRHDQTRACSLLCASNIHELSVTEKEEFTHRSASLYLHSVSTVMSKLSGSTTPFVEKRVITQRWSTSSDLSASSFEIDSDSEFFAKSETCQDYSDLSISSSVDVMAYHEEPFTNTNTNHTHISIDSSQVSEEGQLYSEIEDSIGDSFIEKGDNEKFFDDLIQEEGHRMGAGADNAETSQSLSTATSCSFTHLDTKMINFGTIPIPDGDVKQIQLSVVLDDHEQALEYIRKMRFHFDMEVDPKI